MNFAVLLLFFNCVGLLIVILIAEDLRKARNMRLDLMAKDVERQRKSEEARRRRKFIRNMHDPEFAKIWNASKRLEKETTKGASDE